MKILFAGDYSNMHACLASALRRLGHEAVVVSDRGGHMHTSADISLVRRPGTMGSFRYLYDIFNALPQMKDFDIVQFNNPHFFDLRPGKLQYFFKQLKQNNGHVGLTLAGNDHYFVKSCLDGSTFRFSEFRNVSERTPLSLQTPSREAGYMRKDVENYTRFFYDNLDCGLSLLPEYDIAARPVLDSRLTFINLPVDLSVLSYRVPDLSGKIRLFIGLSSGREVQKGTDVLLKLCRRLVDEMPDRCELTEARNLPLNDYLRQMADSHIVFDQLYSYSPATNALQAMALGAVAVSGAQPEYYKYIESNERPIIEASPATLESGQLYERLKSIILDPTPLLEMSRQGRRLVETNNDSTVVARKAIEVWEKL